jgi:hypothetical protein
MTGMDVLEVIVSLIVFWSLALAPPMLVRFLIVRRPVGKGVTWLFVILGWVVNWTAQYITGGIRQELQGGPPPHPGAISVFLMAWATYAILRYGHKSATVADENSGPSSR